MSVGFFFEVINVAAILTRTAVAAGACSKTLFQWACVFSQPLVACESPGVRRPNLRSKIWPHFFRFAAVVKNALCAHRCSTQKDPFEAR